jgi:hypothetical protein
VPRPQAAALWQRYVDFEGHYGDLASVLRLDRRRTEALSDCTHVGPSHRERERVCVCVCVRTVCMGMLGLTQMQSLFMMVCDEDRDTHAYLTLTHTLSLLLPLFAPWLGSGAGVG